MTITQFVLIVAAIIMLAAGCSGLTPEMIKALADDKASFCMQNDIRGGVGSIMAPMGGYGQGTSSFCRSNQPNAKLSIAADGSISIQHGAE